MILRFLYTQANFVYNLKHFFIVIEIRYLVLIPMEYEVPIFITIKAENQN